MHTRFPEGSALSTAAIRHRIPGAKLCGVFFPSSSFFFFPFSARHGTREQCVLQNSLHRKTESTLLVTWGSQPVQGSYTSFLFICIREELGYSTMSGLFIRRKVKQVLKGNTRMCYTEVTAWGEKKSPPCLAVPRNVWVEPILEKLLLPGALIIIHSSCPCHGSQIFVILCE